MSDESPPEGSEQGVVDRILRESGLVTALPPEGATTAVDLDHVGTALHALAKLVGPLSALKRAVVREGGLAMLTSAGLRSPAKLYDAAVDSQGETERDGPRSGSELTFADGGDEPWSSPVVGADLVAELAATFQRYAVLPPGRATALALWTLHAHAFEAADFSPRLALTSPTKRCGKTRVLEILESLVPKPLRIANLTAAVLYRVIEKAGPTLLVDEADSFLTERDDLRGVINDGFKRGGSVLRCVGDDHEPRAFPCFGPLAIAAIGRLPGTVEDRSILLAMKRKTAAESVHPFRRRDRDGLSDLRRRCARWAADNLAALREAEPVAPTELNDRAADKWEPLFAIADRAAGPWPEQARRAALVLAGDEEGAEVGDLNVALLGDVRSVLRAGGANRVQSEALLSELLALEGRPWSEIDHGRPMTASRLARMLAGFGLKPKAFRMADGKTRRGYEKATFEDAFSRYLPAEAATGATVAEGMGESPTQQPQQEGTVAARELPASARDGGPVAGVAVRGPIENDAAQA